jgi:hypothetical protein
MLESGDLDLTSLKGALDEYFSLKSIVLDSLDLMMEWSTLKFFIIYKISLKLESAAKDRNKGVP